MPEKIKAAGYILQQRRRLQGIWNEISNILSQIAMLDCPLLCNLTTKPDKKQPTEGKNEEAPPQHFKHYLCIHDELYLYCRHA